MDNNKRLSESSSTHNTTCRYPIKDGGIFDTQNQYHAVSLSGGKDSTAMLLLMIERGMPIDVVLTADTGMEFPEMYEHMPRWKITCSGSGTCTSPRSVTRKALSG